MKPKDKLIGKVVLFRDKNSIAHFGVVKRSCRISIGFKKDKVTEKRVRRTLKGYVVFQRFRTLTQKKAGKEYRILPTDIDSVSVRRKSIPFKRFMEENE